MHYHNVRDEPDTQENTYCEAHANHYTELGDFMDLCDCERGERVGCVHCEEHDEVL